MKKFILGAITLFAIFGLALFVAQANDNAGRKIVVFQTGLNDAAKDEIIARTNGSDNGKAEFIQDEIIVKFKGDKEPRVLKVPEGKVGERVKEYKKKADVIYAEPNYIAYALIVPNDPYYKYQWHLDNPVNGGIQTEEAWNISTGSGVKVAVIDTGIRKGTDLANTCFVAGYDYVNKDTDPTDDNGHGTHVAGTIAQSTNNALGVAGVAFNSCLMPVKVLGATGAGTYANVALGIRYAADNGAKVINLSLGGSSDSTTLKDAVAYAYNKGVTVIAAAGNENSTSILYPAAYDDYVVAVGAIQYDETRAPYSNYGPSLDIVAPGGNTAVDQNGDGYGDGVLQQTFTISSGRITWGYYFFQGTSMATPHVSGVAALVIANGVTGPDNVRAALQTTAEEKGSPGWDATYGWGLVDAYKALQWTAGPPDTEAPVITGATGNTTGTTGESVTISATITDNVGVTSAIVYYTPIDGTETAVLVTKAATSDVWSANVPVASNKVGTITYYIKAKDAAGNEVRDPATESYSITVTDNDPPIANAGLDQSVVVNTTVTLDGSGSTDNIGIVSYKWDFNAADGVNWDAPDATGVTTTNSYSVIGTYTVTLQVSDAAGLTVTDTAVITATEILAEVTVFEDSFEVSEWNGLWTEDKQNDWFRSTQRAVGGSYSAEVDGLTSNAKLTSIPINLQGRTNARITFSWYIESSLDLGEYLAFDVSTDGGTTWGEKSRLKGNVDSENTWHNVSIDLTGINNLRIQFRGKMSDATEDANMDMVKVVAR